METDRTLPALRRSVRLIGAVLLTVAFAACSTAPLVGMVYTNVRLPLTTDLAATPVPANRPWTDRIIEIKEPLTGAGIYTRVNINAIGAIARENGVDPLYFADQEIFNILGVWKTHRVMLYGEAFDASE